MTQPTHPIELCQPCPCGQPKSGRAPASVRPITFPSRRFEQASGGADALARLESGFWQVLFLDRHLQDLDATELSDTVRRRFPEIEVVLLDAENDAGPNIVDSAIENVIEKGKRTKRNSARGSVFPKAIRFHLKRTVAREWDRGWLGPGQAGFGRCRGCRSRASLPGMVGRSRVMQPVYRLIRLLAPRKTTVLITCRTGSGKEVVARALHQLSPRAGHTFAVVNCAAIPETLLEAELFGYARGSFTGAMQSYAGRIQAAQGGRFSWTRSGRCH